MFRIELGNQFVDAGFVGGDVVDRDGMALGGEAADNGLATGNRLDIGRISQWKNKTDMPRLEPVTMATRLSIFANSSGTLVWVLG